jgi:hypothetical protein
LKERASQKNKKIKKNLKKKKKIGFQVKIAEDVEDTEKRKKDGESVRGL